jgi:hypothetical protein
MSGASENIHAQGASAAQHQTESEPHSPNSGLSPYQQKLLHIVKGSLAGNSAETGLDEAIQKIDLLHQATPPSPEKAHLAALLDALVKTSAHDLTHPESKSAWLAQLFTPKAPPLQLDPAFAALKPNENPFAAKPIAPVSNIHLTAQKAPKKDTPKAPLGSFWNRVKRAFS